MIQSGVYTILNTQNGMRYVGSSSNLDFRMEQHFHLLDDGRHFNFNLQKAYQHCGDVWAWIILEYCEVFQLAQAEQKWINRGMKLLRLYNIDLVVDPREPVR
jgi:group I intron endonuclease